MKIFIQIHVSILQQYNKASKAIYSRIVDFDKLVQILYFSLNFYFLFNFAEPCRSKFQTNEYVYNSDDKLINGRATHGWLKPESECKPQSSGHLKIPRNLSSDTDVHHNFIPGTNKCKMKQERANRIYGIQIQQKTNGTQYEF